LRIGLQILFLLEVGLRGREVGRPEGSYFKGNGAIEADRLPTGGAPRGPLLMPRKLRRIEANNARRLHTTVISYLLSML
jgi:hypothetical protein